MFYLRYFEMRILFSHNIMVEYACGKNKGRKKDKRQNMSG